MNLEEVAQSLANGDGDARTLADQLVQLVAIPSSFDVALEALETRFRKERDRGARDAIFRAKKSIARARGRAIGLRAKLEDAVEDYDDRGLVWAAIVYVWDAASIYDGPDALARDLAQASAMQRGLYGLWWTRSEVANGGLSQYFYNHTAVVAPFALAGLTQLGATKSVELLSRALAVFGDTLPVDIDARREALATLDDAPLRVLDGALLAALDGEAFPAAAHHVRAHVDEFFDQ